MRQLWETPTRKTFGQQFLLPLLFLRLQSVLSLQPALGRLVGDILVFFEGSEVLGDAADVVGLALLGGMVAGWEVAEGRTGSEEGEKVGGKLVGHREEKLGADKGD